MWISVWLSWRTLMPYLSIRSCWRRIQTLWKPLKWWVFSESHFNGKFPYKTILMGRVPVKPSSVPVNHWKSTWYWQMLNCEHITDSKNKDVMYSCDIQFHLGTFLIQILMVYWCVTIIHPLLHVVHVTLCQYYQYISLHYCSIRNILWVHLNWPVEYLLHFWSCIKYTLCLTVEKIQREWEDPTEGRGHLSQVQRFLPAGRRGTQQLGT